MRQNHFSFSSLQLFHGLRILKSYLINPDDCGYVGILKVISYPDNVGILEDNPKRTAKSAIKD